MNSPGSFVSFLSGASNSGVYQESIKGVAEHCIFENHSYLWTPAQCPNPIFNERFGLPKGPQWPDAPFGMPMIKFIESALLSSILTILSEAAHLDWKMHKPLIVRWPHIGVIHPRLY